MYRLPLPSRSPSHHPRRLRHLDPLAVTLCSSSFPHERRFHAAGSLGGARSPCHWPHFVAAGLRLRVLSPRKLVLGVVCTAKSRRLVSGGSRQVRFLEWSGSELPRAVY
ncbi:hypothetical protein SEVIR_9G449251v4 [Setaria viridis]